MKLRVTVDGKAYMVEVEPAETGVIASAASRVEGASVRTSVAAALPAPRRASGPNGKPASPAPAKPEPVAERLPERPPWHGLSVGSPGECTAPVPGTIKRVLVKPGDTVKKNDALVHIEVSSVLSPREKPLVGTVRALESGVVAEVTVKEGQTVAFAQPLVRVGAKKQG